MENAVKLLPRLDPGDHLLYFPLATDGNLQEIRALRDFNCASDFIPALSGYILILTFSATFPERKLKP
jgi:hypothetical protein